MPNSNNDNVATAFNKVPATNFAPKDLACISQVVAENEEKIRAKILNEVKAGEAKESETQNTPNNSEQRKKIPGLDFNN